MVCRIRKLNGLKQYGMEWDGWDDFFKYGVKDIVQGFGKLKKWLKKNKMEWNGL